MKIIDIVHSFAGAFILLGIALAYFINPWFILISGFVGVNLFQFGFTGFCPLSIILKKLGCKH